MESLAQNSVVRPKKREKSAPNPFQWLTYPYVGWITALIVIPMILIVFYAFTVQGNDVVSIKFSLDNFISFLTDPTYLTVVAKSLWIAFITTIVCIILGYPIAYIISKAKGKHGIILILLLTFPTWINMLARTYAWMGMLDKGGFIANIANALGYSGNLLYTDFAVILGMVYNFLPFMILQIHNSLAKMDNSLLEAAADLGANKVQSFLRVTFPLSLPGIVSGITLVFLPAVSSFFIPKLLGGGQFVLVGNVIENQFLTSANWHMGSAISLIMAVIIIFSMWLTRKIDVQPKRED